MKKFIYTDTDPYTLCEVTQEEPGVALDVQRTWFHITRIVT